MAERVIVFGPGVSQLGENFDQVPAAHPLWSDEAGRVSIERAAENFTPLDQSIVEPRGREVAKLALICPRAADRISAGTDQAAMKLQSLYAGQMFGDDVEIAVLAPLDRERTFAMAPGPKGGVAVGAMGSVIVGNEQVQDLFDSPLLEQRFGALQPCQVKRRDVMNRKEDLQWWHIKTSILLGALWFVKGDDRCCRRFDRKLASSIHAARRGADFSGVASSCWAPVS